MIGYTPRAARDIVHLQARLRDFNARAAETFAFLLARGELRIVQSPTRYRLLRDRLTRRYSFKVNRITYLVDYRIAADQIVVLRVWHGRQDRPE